MRQDRDSVYDWEEVQSKRGEFSDVIDRCQEEEDAVVVWICKFCENKNVVECDQVRFANKNSKVVLKAGGSGGEMQCREASRRKTQSCWWCSTSAGRWTKCSPTSSIATRGSLKRSRTLRSTRRSWLTKSER